MLIKLLYIQSTQLSPLQENYRTRNGWDLGIIACPPNRVLFTRVQRQVCWAGDPTEEKPLMHCRSLGNSQLRELGGLWSC